MVDAHHVQDRGVIVMNVYRIVRNVDAVFVTFPVGQPAADTGASADPGATVAMPTTEITAAGRLDAAVPPVFRLDAATEARVVAALAAHVGPVAKVLVKRELKQARDLGDLATRLGSNVDDAGAQAAFTSLVRGLG